MGKRSPVTKIDEQKHQKNEKHQFLQTTNPPKNPIFISPLKPPQNPLNQHSSEQNYRNICIILLSLTRSRSLPKGLQLHAHIIKSGIQIIPLISHHLINFYSKTQLPLCSRQVFFESPRKSSTTWSSIISSFAQNDFPSLAIQFFRDMLHDNIRPVDHGVYKTLGAFQVGAFQKLLLLLQLGCVGCAEETKERNKELFKLQKLFKRQRKKE